MANAKIVFVPFLGDLFSMITCTCDNAFTLAEFSSPLSGTFFQYIRKLVSHKYANVFVPSLGDFFSIKKFLPL